MNAKTTVLGTQGSPGGFNRFPAIPYVRVMLRTLQYTEAVALSPVVRTRMAFSELVTTEMSFTLRY